MLSGYSHVFLFDELTGSMLSAVTEHVLVSGGVARVKRYTDSLKLGTHQSGTICRCF